MSRKRVYLSPMPACMEDGERAIKVISLAKAESQLFLFLTVVLMLSVVTSAQNPTDPVLIPKYEQAVKLYRDAVSLKNQGRAGSKSSQLTVQRGFVLNGEAFFV